MREDRWIDWIVAQVEIVERVRDVVPDLSGQRLEASDTLRLSHDRDFEPMALSEGSRA